MRRSRRFGREGGSTRGDRGGPIPRSPAEAAEADGSAVSPDRRVRTTPGDPGQRLRAAMRVVGDQWILDPIRASRSRPGASGAGADRPSDTKGWRGSRRRPGLRLASAPRKRGRPGGHRGTLGSCCRITREAAVALETLRSATRRGQGGVADAGRSGRRGVPRILRCGRGGRGGRGRSRGGDGGESDGACGAAAETAWAIGSLRGLPLSPTHPADPEDSATAGAIYRRGRRA